LVAEDKLLEPAYTSPAGSIAPLDMIFGFRPSMAKGNLYMAHRCGFTQRVLIATLKAAGFGAVGSIRRGPPFFDLWAAATVSESDAESLRTLATAHFPLASAQPAGAGG